MKLHILAAVAAATLTLAVPRPQIQGVDDGCDAMDLSSPTCQTLVEKCRQARKALNQDPAFSLRFLHGSPMNFNEKIDGGDEFVRKCWDVAHVSMSMNSNITEEQWVACHEKKLSAAECEKEMEMELQKGKKQPPYCDALPRVVKTPAREETITPKPIGQADDHLTHQLAASTETRAQEEESGKAQSSQSITGFVTANQASILNQESQSKRPIRQVDTQIPADIVAQDKANVHTSSTNGNETGHAAEFTPVTQVSAAIKRPTKLKEEDPTSTTNEEQLIGKEEKQLSNKNETLVSVESEKEVPSESERQAPSDEERPNEDRPLSQAHHHQPSRHTSPVRMMTELPGLGEKVADSVKPTIIAGNVSKTKTSDASTDQEQALGRHEQSSTTNGKKMKVSSGEVAESAESMENPHLTVDEASEVERPVNDQPVPEVDKHLSANSSVSVEGVIASDKADTKSFTEDVVMKDGTDKQEQSQKVVPQQQSDSQKPAEDGLTAEKVEANDQAEKVPTQQQVNPQDAASTVIQEEKMNGEDQLEKVENIDTQQQTDLHGSAKEVIKTDKATGQDQVEEGKPQTEANTRDAATLVITAEKAKESQTREGSEMRSEADRQQIAETIIAANRVGAESQVEGATPQLEAASQDATQVTSQAEKINREEESEEINSQPGADERDTVESIITEDNFGAESQVEEIKIQPQVDTQNKAEIIILADQADAEIQDEEVTTQQQAETQNPDEMSTNEGQGLENGNVQLQEVRIQQQAGTRNATEEVIIAEKVDAKEHDENVVVQQEANLVGNGEWGEEEDSLTNRISFDQDGTTDMSKKTEEGNEEGGEEFLANRMSFGQDWTTDASEQTEETRNNDNEDLDKNVQGITQNENVNGTTTQIASAHDDDKTEGRTQNGDGHETTTQSIDGHGREKIEETRQSNNEHGMISHSIGTDESKKTEHTTKEIDEHETTSQLQNSNERESKDTKDMMKKVDEHETTAQNSNEKESNKLQEIKHGLSVQGTTTQNVAERGSKKVEETGQSDDGIRATPSVLTGDKETADEMPEINEHEPTLQSFDEHESKKKNGEQNEDSGQIVSEHGNTLIEEMARTSHEHEDTQVGQTIGVTHEQESNRIGPMGQKVDEYQRDQAEGTMRITSEYGSKHSTETTERERVSEYNRTTTTTTTTTLDASKASLSEETAPKKSSASSYKHPVKTSTGRPFGYPILTPDQENALYRSCMETTHVLWPEPDDQQSSCEYFSRKCNKFALRWHTRFCAEDIHTQIERQFRDMYEATDTMITPEEFYARAMVSVRATCVVGLVDMTGDYESICEGLVKKLGAECEDLEDETKYENCWGGMVNKILEVLEALKKAGKIDPGKVITF